MLLPRLATRQLTGRSTNRHHERRGECPLMVLADRCLGYCYNSYYRTNRCTILLHYRSYRKYPAHWRFWCLRYECLRLNYHNTTPHRLYYHYRCKYSRCYCCLHGRQIPIRLRWAGVRRNARHKPWHRTNLHILPDNFPYRFAVQTVRRYSLFDKNTTHI